MNKAQKYAGAKKCCYMVCAPVWTINLIMLKVQMYTGAIRMLLYGLHVCTDDNPLAKAHGLSCHTDVQPYNKLISVHVYNVNISVRTA